MSNPATPGLARIGISRSSKVVEDISDLVDMVALVCGPSTSSTDLDRVNADVVLVRDVDDLSEQLVLEADAILVVASGLDLMCSLLGDDRVASSTRILWSLGLPLNETLGTLSSLKLPVGIVVTGFCGSPDRSILLTAARDDAMYDIESFQMGLKAAMPRPPWSEESGISERQAHESRLLQELIDKHVSLLSSLGAAGLPLSSSVNSSPGAAITELQDQLTQLNRKHAALERKYNSLAQSKLGSITLRIWKRKRLSAPAVRNATRP